MSLSLEQRRVLDMLCYHRDMPTMYARTTPDWFFREKVNDQQVLTSIEPDTRARVKSLMQYEYNLRQEWFAMHAVLVENARHERRACQTEMRAEVARLDKALSVEGITKIVGHIAGSGIDDIQRTLTLLAVRRKRVKRQYIRSNYIFGAHGNYMEPDHI